MILISTLNLERNKLHKISSKSDQWMKDRKYPILYCINLAGIVVELMLHIFIKIVHEFR